MGDLIAKVCIGVTLLLLGVFVIALGGLIAAIPLYYLWNWLMPAILEYRTITYWQAWGLFFLCGLLFKSQGSSTSNSKNS